MTNQANLGQLLAVLINTLCTVESKTHRPTSNNNSPYSMVLDDDRENNTTEKQRNDLELAAEFLIHEIYGYASGLSDTQTLSSFYRTISANSTDLDEKDAINLAKKIDNQETQASFLLEVFDELMHQSKIDKAAALTAVWTNNLLSSD